MEKVNQNLQKNRPQKISGKRGKRSRVSGNQISDTTSNRGVLKRNRQNQGIISNTAGKVIFEVGLLVALPPKPVPIGDAAPDQCFYCHKNIKDEDIFMYRYIFVKIKNKAHLVKKKRVLTWFRIR